MEKKKFNFLGFLFKTIFFITLILFLSTFFLFFRYGTSLPNYEQLANYKPSVSSRFFADDGSLLTEYAAEKRIYLELKDIPVNVVNAFMSAEDKNFYHHSGIDFKGITRAFLGNVKNKITGSNARPKGASTITQQVSKNFFLTSDVSISRKIKEMILALKIERTFSKDYIMTLYLNKIYLGFYSYGVAAAAHNYFDKSLDQLTIGECAFLAALPKAPNNYNPLTNKEKAMERRNWVLGRMLQDNKITKEQYNSSIAEDLIVSNKFTVNLHSYSMYFAEEARKTVSEQFSDDILYQEGFSVYLTMNPELQKMATLSLKRGIINYDRAHGYRGPIGNVGNVSKWRSILITEFAKPSGLPKSWEIAVILGINGEEADVGLIDNSRGVLPLKNMQWARKNLPNQSMGPAITSINQVLKVGDVILVSLDEQGILSLQQNPKVNGAMVVMDPESGKVLAMVGGFSYEQSKFNRSTQALRQVGSVIKPFVYLTALQRNDYHPFTILLDAPVVMDRGGDAGLWKPENYEKSFKGNLTLRSALELSRNSPTIRLANELGLTAIVDTFKNFGIYNKDMTESGLSLALGSGESTLMRITGAFATFANGGYKITPYFIEKVQDRDGRTLYRNDNRQCPICAGPRSNSTVIPDVADERERIIDPQTNYQMVSILKGVVQRGSGTPANISGAYLAGKTGTSSETKDAWFIGFSDKLLVGIYVGFDKPSTLGNTSAGMISAPIFKDFMTEALKLYPSSDFKIPEGITFIRLNKADGTFAEGASEDGVIIEAVKDDEVSQIMYKSSENTDRQNQNGTTNNYNADVGGLY